MIIRCKEEWWVNFWIVYLCYCLNISDCFGLSKDFKWGCGKFIFIYFFGILIVIKENDW